MLTSCKVGISQEDQKTAGWEGSTASPAASQKSLIFRSGIHFGPSSEIWTSKSRVVRKQPNEHKK